MVAPAPNRWAPALALLLGLLAAERCQRALCLQASGPSAPSAPGAPRAGAAPAGPAPNATRASPKKEAGQRAAKRRLMVECLAAHNKWRRLHGAPELVWDDKIARFAQKRSDHIAASDGAEFRHPADLAYGENLFWHSSAKQACEFMVRGWYDEIRLYDFKRPDFDHATGHFTQLVWRSTERLGCATATSSKARGGVYLTCNYDPPGNYKGEFADNVVRPSTSSSSSSSSSISTGNGNGNGSSTATPPTMAPSGAATTSTTTSSPATVGSTTRRPGEQRETTKPKAKKKKKKKSKKKQAKKRSGSKKKKSNSSSSSSNNSSSSSNSNNNSTTPAPTPKPPSG